MFPSIRYRMEHEGGQDAERVRKGIKKQNRVLTGWVCEAEAGSHRFKSSLSSCPKTPKGEAVLSWHQILKSKYKSVYQMCKPRVREHLAQSHTAIRDTVKTQI